MRPPQRTSAHLRDERGFAIPIALLVLMVMLALVGAAAVSAVSSSSQSRTDLNALRAQQAADAGLRIAAYDYNALGLDIGPLFTQTSGTVNGSCFKGSIASGTEEATQAGEEGGKVKWCPPVTNSIGDGATYSYVASPANQAIIREHEVCTAWLIICLAWESERETTVTRTVVATGTAGNETRVAKDEVKMTGIIYKACGLLCLTKVEHATITKYYTVIPDSYRQCPITAAQVSIGQTLLGQEPKC